MAFQILSDSNLNFNGSIKEGCMCLNLVKEVSYHVIALVQLSISRY